MKFVCFFAAVLLLLCNCQSAPKTPEALKAEMEAGPLAFLQDGKTTREEVLLRLGAPTATFESQRIVTYRLWWSSASGLAVWPLEPKPPYGETKWEGLDGSLVLVFDPANRLARHNLVPMKIALTTRPS